MKQEFMITRQNKQYVLFAGLLDEAHSRGLRSIDTELLQVPSDQNGNVAIVKATAEMEDGRRFSGIGDASVENVGRNIAPHIIRMAETRAKARALRDGVNVGVAALEELSGDEDSTSTPAPATPVNNVSQLRAAQKDASEAKSAIRPDDGASEKQMKYLVYLIAENQKARGGEVDIPQWEKDNLSEGKKVRTLTKNEISQFIELQKELAEGEAE